MKVSATFLLIFLFFLAACEQPRQVSRRLGQNDDFQTYNFGNPYSDNNDDDANDDSNNDDNNNDNGNSTPNVVIPNDASHCRWSTDTMSGYTHIHPLIGEYTLCRGQINQNVAYIQVKNPITQGPRLCFIPTTKVPGTTTDTTYLGNPHCDYFYKNDTIYRLNFNITRFPFGNNNPRIDGFIILKDEQAPYPGPFPFVVSAGRLMPQNGGILSHYQAYYGCMDALELCSSRQIMCPINAATYCQAFEAVGRFINHFPF